MSQSMNCMDHQGAEPTFPDPKVIVNCNADTASAVVVAEPCPPPAEIELGRCQDAAVVSANETCISGLGRIVQVDVVIKNVCPGKRTAVAVILSELDAEGMEYARGIKTVLIPAQNGRCCQDVQLKCINFVLPEVMDVSGPADSICNVRKFYVRVMANYVDTDFVCCDVQV